MIKKIDLKHNELKKIDLKNYTDGMSKPCIFYNFPLKQDLESLTIDNILSLENQTFLSNVHNGSYWASKPLHAEILGRRRLNLSSMFSGNSGDYYVTYFKPKNPNSKTWETTRTSGNNEFDDLLSNLTNVKDYMRGSSLINHWISNGNTLSSLHGDPLDTLFVQVQGAKDFTIIPESMKTFFLANFKQPHRLRYSLSDLQNHDLFIEEVRVEKGMAVFMPAWCFHEIASVGIGLNISLTTHYNRERKLFSFSPFQLANKFVRFWYPKLVRKKRIQFQLDNSSLDSVPFFPWFSSYLTNNLCEIDTVYQHKRFLINRKSCQIRPVENATLSRILNEINGHSSLKDISERTHIQYEELLTYIHQLIRDEYIQILFEAEDKYNYFYQNIEPKILK
ncbi:cupin-like domain-containing protein [Vibrio cholerae]|uniref:cupin-like domain-containing protein n=1 Tax=Vibrio cholerae TaxID=666 RepID=UPI001A9EF5F2|nr:cupin-like domain-containing protein [Vibrio cholerae]EHY8702334.1 cupin-like domain-containing protein [Vibrio cholerae]EII3092292.1 cupin-like domain-containing protein [Vibrio cholerae]EJK2283226.1 cupin-like domain-containing protein [Vibrio cholerae]EJL6423317.1 cupin-like domain-containing protein [Vibrio cholerae]EJL6835843.1 cupin-like domain-containing protein [Vibrio cholerae]